LKNLYTLEEEHQNTETKNVAYPKEYRFLILLQLTFNIFSVHRNTLNILIY